VFTILLYTADPRDIRYMCINSQFGSEDNMMMMIW
jgi:hypothetical protein